MRMKMAQGCLMLGLLAGCRSPKPTFDWDVLPEVTMEQEVEIALDPRMDRIVLEEGHHPVDSSVYRGMVMNSLLHKGYRIVPASEARLWVSVQALASGESRPGPADATAYLGHLRIVVELFEPRRDQPRWRGTVELPARGPEEKGGLDTGAQIERLLEPIGKARQEGVSG